MLNEKGAILPTVMVILLISTTILLYINDITLSHANKLKLLETSYHNQAALLYAEQRIESEYVEERPDQLSFQFNTAKVIAEKTDENSYEISIAGDDYLNSNRHLALQEIPVEEIEEESASKEDANSQALDSEENSKKPVDESEIESKEASRESTEESEESSKDSPVKAPEETENSPEEILKETQSLEQN